MTHQAGIYRITCQANGRFYIGSSVRLAARLADHKSKMKRGKHENEILQRCVDKYGFESMSFEIVLFCDPDKTLFYEDKFLDRDYDKKLCMNLGRKAVAPMSGRNHSQATRDQMSLSHKGKKLSQEVRDKIGKAHKGKKLSEETKAKIRAARRDGNTVRIYHQAGWSLELESEVAVDRYLGLRTQHINDFFRKNGNAARPKANTKLANAGITFLERI